MDIKNRVINSSLEEWAKFEFIQMEEFKELDEETARLIANSIVKNNFTEVFYAWRNGEKIICIDGYQRIKKIFPLLEMQGHNIPAKLLTVFVDCKNESEAAELVLQYNSYYAKLNESATLQHIEKFNLDFSSITSIIKFPDIDLSAFIQNEKFERVDIKEEKIVPFKKTHVLLSFRPERLIDLKPLLEQIKNLGFVEYEQSSN